MVGPCVLPLSTLCSQLQCPGSSKGARVGVPNPVFLCHGRVTSGRSPHFSESFLSEATGRKIPAKACRKESEKET